MDPQPAAVEDAGPAVTHVPMKRQQKEPPEGLVTMADFARQRGVSHEAVRRAVQTGRIRLIGGFVDPIQAERDWNRNTNPAKAPKRSRPRPSPETHVQTSAPPPPPGPPDRKPPARAAAVVEPELFDYNIASAEHEHHKARLAKMRADEAEGKLVDADRLKLDLFEAYRTLRASLETIPDRIAEVLAGETDPVVTHKILLDEIQSSLEKLSDGMNREASAA